METFTLDRCTIEAETDKALRIKYDCEIYWIPLSQVVKTIRSKNKECDSVTMTSWIAKQKEFV